MCVEHVHCNTILFKCSRRIDEIEGIMNSFLSLQADKLHPRLNNNSTLHELGIEFDRNGVEPVIRIRDAATQEYICWLHRSAITDQE